MKLKIITLLFFLIPLFVFSEKNDTSGLGEYYDEAMKNVQTIEKAKVLKVLFDDTDEVRENTPIESDFRVQHLEIKLLSGPFKGKTYKIQNQIQMVMPFKIICHRGDKILVQVDTNAKGAVSNLIIYDRDRSGVIYFSLFSFIFLLLLIGRKQGFHSLISLLITIGLIFFIFLPMIIRGYSPLLSSFLVCFIATFATLFIVAGVNKKSISAILGTLLGTLSAIIFALIAGKLAKLTGLGSEEAQMLAFIPQHRNIHYQSLLFAGIAIGALGAVMDTALSISSAMTELLRVNPKLSLKELRHSGMLIGRDIIGSMSNTLILAYTSTSLPLILLMMLFNTKLKDVMNLDVIASEILRASAGSIGLILTIPLTVIIRCIMEKKSSK